jgi:hypothetical protein
MSDIHTYPLDDLREHEMKLDCWCHPTPDAEFAELILHRAMDERESYEQGRKLQ